MNKKQITYSFYYTQPRAGLKAYGYLQIFNRSEIILLLNQKDHYGTLINSAQL
jgi:hypothetical protein